MADIAYNPQTGEALRLEGGQWVPTQVAKNDRGDVMAYDGASWTSVGGGKSAQPERSTGERAVRGVGFTAQALNDAAAGAVGSLGDLAQGGMPVLPNDIIKSAAKRIGIDLPIGTLTSKDARDAIDWVATLGRTTGDTARLTPETTTEKIIYGGAKGLGDAALMLTGAGAVSRLSQGGTLAKSLAESLAAGPGTQLAASGAGSAVGEATGSPGVGLITALGVGAAPTLARTLARPNVGSLTAEQTRLADIAAREGIPLTTGQQTGSKAIQTLESVLGNMPISGGMVKAQTQGQREAFNAAALKRAGIEADTATPEVLAARQAELGKTFDDVTRRSTIKVDDPLIEDLIGVADKYLPKIEPTKRSIVKAYIDDITAPGRETIPGDMYQETRSLLRNQANSYAANDYATSKALKSIRNALDEAMERSVSPGDAAAFRGANKDYANLKTIMKAMEGAGGDVASGNVSPARLRMAAAQAAKGNYATGGGDLNELARVGEAFVKPQIPDSGTAQRAMWQGILAGGAGGSVAAGSPLAAILALGSAPATQKALQSETVRRYLTRKRGEAPDAAGLMSAILAERTRPMIEGR